MRVDLQITKQRFQSVSKIKVGETSDDFVKNRTSVKIIGSDERGLPVSETLQLDLDGTAYVQTAYVWCADCGIFMIGESKSLLDQTSQAGVVFRPLVLEADEHTEHRGFGVLDVTRGAPNVRDRVRWLRELIKDGIPNEQ